ncbi:unnamed protein product [Sphagnum jensenii]|jgi:hypothetical protein|uniref:Chitin-binding type-2 domain-containing protein n=1 Tax=Sphagnum jensenii TaxID=128206 RepID=A0ABP0VJ13_9BRYO
MPCAPKDLVYDDSQKQCDWQSDSNVCKVPTEAPTTEASTTEAPTTEASTTEAPTTEASTTEASVTEICTTEPETETPTTNTPTDSTTDTPIDSTTDTPIDSTTDASTTPSSGFVCPEEDIADTGCKGPTDCLYPNPENCNSFIQCVPQPDGSGEPVVMPCPAGLEWNDNKKQCDYPPDSTCPKRPY